MDRDVDLKKLSTSLNEIEELNKTVSGKITICSNITIRGDEKICSAINRMRKKVEDDLILAQKSFALNIKNMQEIVDDTHRVKEAEEDLYQI